MDQKFTRQINEIDKKFTGKFNEMDQKFTGKFDEMDQKFTGVEKLIVSERNRSKNKLLADGGDLYSPNAYLPIFNDCGESPGDRGLEPLTSLTQIDRMNGILIDNYLTFYQIGTSRLVSEKKARLMEYIGIHERVVVNSVRGMSPV
ncbi:uncharacterized protein AC631_04565 [Debaryomyces fabryi]|uniref:Mug135-like C-terminal domain-containing protein n=1 Tax=Debaryomyces fabryi TaxID=58627 RepID=A0A0V1PTV3_9ASCO|nr:uncharacterized protein AC631_04565 [Debaryomyces fabryi]KRZ99658.1 hypothetical protein AC631_04565 [Debaryomyces fabryi]